VTYIYLSYRKSIVAEPPLVLSRGWKKFFLRGQRVALPMSCSLLSSDKKHRSIVQICRNLEEQQLPASKFMTDLRIASKCRGRHGGTTPTNH